MTDSGWGWAHLNAYEVQAYEVQAYEVQAYEVLAYQALAYQVPPNKIQGHSCTETWRAAC
jgi:hypothetical protein